MSKKKKKIKPNNPIYTELEAGPVTTITIPDNPIRGMEYRVIAFDDMERVDRQGTYRFRLERPPEFLPATTVIRDTNPPPPEPPPIEPVPPLPEDLNQTEWNRWRDNLLDRMRRQAENLRVDPPRRTEATWGFGAPPPQRRWEPHTQPTEQRNETMRTLAPHLATMADAYIELKNVNLPVNDAPGIAQGTPGNTVFSERNEFKINKLKRLVSVEIEIAGCKLPDYIYPVTKKWQCSIVEDQSLPRMGFEINTAPANGDKFVEQMVEFDECFLQAGAWVNERCGMHTHADARDFNAYDVRRMIKLYSKLERGLFDIVPPDRRHTKYATPCGDALMAKITSVAHPKTSKRRLIETLYTDVDDFKRMKETKAIDPLKRRRALNIHSWAFRKTFELRLPEGSVEAVDMINWGILWGTIVDTAYKMGERMIDSMGTDSFQLLLDVAPTPAIEKWIQKRKGDYK